MKEKKLLNINPDMFSVSSFNTTKKRKKAEPKENIKVKSSYSIAEKNKNKSLKKRSLLRMIREQQQKSYDKMFSVPKQSDNKQIFENEFEKATEFLDNLVKNKTQQTSVVLDNNRNKTLKSTIYEPITLKQPIALPGISLPVNSPQTLQLNPISTLSNIEPPKYGCLKNGTLPTYRSYINQTKKNIFGGNENSKEPVSLQSQIQTQELQNQTINRIKDKSLNIQQQEMNKVLIPKNVKRPKKQKKTIKRTYKVGRSINKPQVSVLVSNKTIRNNITTKKQLLKQDSIPEIKKYLIKHGFIKVGSTTPNDILRKMYETALLICGEVVNHNPDNLLYNFVNSKDN